MQNENSELEGGRVVDIFGFEIYGIESENSPLGFL